MLVALPKKKSKIKQMMNEFYDAVHDISYKNQGGCLFFCYVYLLMLEKYNLSTKRFHIVQYSYEKYEIEQNRNWINNGEYYPTSSFHFSWVHNGLEMDSETQGNENIMKCNKRGTLRGDSKILKEFMEMALSYYDDWNRVFQRDEAIQILEERLGLDLSKVS
jgi:hypothetical protein